MIIWKEMEYEHLPLPMTMIYLKTYQNLLYNLFQKILLYQCNTTS